jgi:hypothetical protein
MGDNLFGIDIQGLEQVQRALKSLHPKIVDEASDDLAKYLINVFRMYPPKNYITRTQAYGKPFQSDRQRRWFFANLNEGNINVPYNRTQGMASAWTITGKGVKTIITNDTEAARWTMSDDQSQHEKLVGWKKITTIVEERAQKIEDVLSGAAKKAIRKLGFK